ncbi:hypothetical protein ACJJTC_018323 [Scirpophaga incertulas]
MHTLHSRAAQIFKWWKDEADQGQGAEEYDLWEVAWMPLLEGIAEFCTDQRQQVANSALTSSAGAAWEACFVRVLFPLLARMPRGPAAARANTVLCKVFLQHLSALSGRSSFPALWARVLRQQAALVHAPGDALPEAALECLKNVLLVMDSVRVSVAARAARCPLPAACGGAERAQQLPGAVGARAAAAGRAGARARRRAARGRARVPQERAARHGLCARECCCACCPLPAARCPLPVAALSGRSSFPALWARVLRQQAALVHAPGDALPEAALECLKNVLLVMDSVRQLPGAVGARAAAAGRAGARARRRAARGRARVPQERAARHGLCARSFPALWARVLRQQAALVHAPGDALPEAALECLKNVLLVMDSVRQLPGAVGARAAAAGRAGARARRRAARGRARVPQERAARHGLCARECCCACCPLPAARCPLPVAALSGRSSFPALWARVLRQQAALVHAPGDALPEAALECLKNVLLVMDSVRQLPGAVGARAAAAGRAGARARRRAARGRARVPQERAARHGLCARECCCACCPLPAARCPLPVAALSGRSSFPALWARVLRQQAALVHAPGDALPEAALECLKNVLLVMDSVRQLPGAVGARAAAAGRAGARARRRAARGRARVPQERAARHGLCARECCCACCPLPAARCPLPVAALSGRSSFPALWARVLRQQAALVHAPGDALPEAALECLKNVLLVMDSVRQAALVHAPGDALPEAALECLKNVLLVMDSVRVSVAARAARCPLPAACGGAERAQQLPGAVGARAAAAGRAGARARRRAARGRARVPQERAARHGLCARECCCACCPLPAARCPLPVAALSGRSSFPALWARVLRQQAALVHAPGDALPEAALECLKNVLLVMDSVRQLPGAVGARAAAAGRAGARARRRAARGRARVPQERAARHGLCARECCCACCPLPAARCPLPVAALSGRSSFPALWARVLRQQAALVHAPGDALPEAALECLKNVLLVMDSVRVSVAARAARCPLPAACGGAERAQQLPGAVGARAAAAGRAGARARRRAARGRARVPQERAARHGLCARECCCACCPLPAARCPLPVAALSGRSSFPALWARVLRQQAALVHAPGDALPEAALECLKNVLLVMDSVRVMLLRVLPAARCPLPVAALSGRSSFPALWARVLRQQAALVHAPGDALPEAALECLKNVLLVMDSVRVSVAARAARCPLPAACGGAERAQQLPGAVGARAAAAGRAGARARRRAARGRARVPQERAARHGLCARECCCACCPLPAARCPLPVAALSGRSSFPALWARVLRQQAALVHAPGDALPEAALECLKNVLLVMDSVRVSVAARAARCPLPAACGGAERAQQLPGAVGARAAAAGRAGARARRRAARGRARVPQERAARHGLCARECCCACCPLPAARCPLPVAALSGRSSFPALWARVLRQQAALVHAPGDALPEAALECLKNVLLVMDSVRVSVAARAARCPLPAACGGAERAQQLPGAVGARAAAAGRAGARARRRAARGRARVPQERAARHGLCARECCCACCPLPAARCPLPVAALSGRSSFPALWARVLRQQAALVHAPGDALPEAALECLKNVLLVMDSVRIFTNGDTYNELWYLTWAEINEFLPNLKNELFPAAKDTPINLPSVQSPSLPSAPSLVPPQGTPPNVPPNLPASGPALGGPAAVSGMVPIRNPLYDQPALTSSVLLQPLNEVPPPPPPPPPLPPPPPSARPYLLRAAEAPERGTSTTTTTITTTTSPPSPPPCC